MTEPVSLDPAKSMAVNDCIIIGDLFEGLTTATNDGTIHPGVATSWSVSDDGKRWEFHLNKKAKWSDGQPLTAHDFVHSFQRLLNPSTGSPHTSTALLANIAFSQEVVSGKRPPEHLGVKAIDSHTLSLQLDYPALHLPEMLSSCIFAPVPAHKVKALGQQWSHNTHLVSNGPFKLKSVIPGHQTVLARNSYYTAVHMSQPEEVFYKVITSSHAEMWHFISGEIDITSSIPREHIQHLKQQRPNEVTSIPAQALIFLSINLQDSALQNPPVKASTFYGY